MKVNLGPYTSDLIPVRRWEKNYEIWSSKGKYYLDEEDYTWYDKIVFGFFDKLDNLVRPINRWSNGRKRKIKVHVDNYDVWSLDHTLGIIIAPCLKKLKEQQHGAPSVYPLDVPRDVRNLSAEDRWNWVLDEMIWTFEQYAMDDDNAQFSHNVDQLEILFKPLEDNPKLNSLDFNYQKDPSKPAYYRDEEGLKKHNQRKKNGLWLFAKYYDALWD